MGYVVASVGLLSAEVPYTAFYARKSYIENNNELISNFTKAIKKGIDYTFSHDNKDIAKIISKQFSDIDINDLEIMIGRYKDYDCFLNTPYIDEKLFTNLEDFLIEFDLIKDYVPYNKLINNFYHE